jgi:hypothetical protein
MNTELRNSLLRELDSLERELNDPTLTDSERQRLDQVWEDVNDRMDDLDGLFIAIPPIDDLAWQDAREGLDTPPPPSPIRMAPPPPPRFPSVPRSLSSHGVPTLSSTNLLGLHPSEPVAVHSPEPDDAPHTPRAWEPSEEEIDSWNNLEDDREGCAHCPGCAYCRGDDGYGYDGADEI